MFCKLCQLVKEGLNQLEKSQLEELFKALGSVNPLVVENVSEPVLCNGTRRDVIFILILTESGCMV